MKLPGTITRIIRDLEGAEQLRGMPPCESSGSDSSPT